MAVPIFKVSADARGKLRLLKQDLDTKQAKLADLLPKLALPIADFVARGSLKGRQRAFAKLDAALKPYAHLCDVQFSPVSLALWATLEPRVSVAIDPNDPSLMQDCITVNYLLVGAMGPRVAGNQEGRWTLEVSDHALHQLITRAPGVDVARTILNAHRSALHLPSRVRPSHSRTIHLRADPGVFVCQMEYGEIPDDESGASASGELTIYVRCKTWLHTDQLRDDQQPVADGLPGGRLGEGCLRPVPLRTITEDGESIEIATARWAHAAFGLPG